MKTMMPALVLALAGCSAQNPGHESAKVGVALTATGVDGATYRLQPGTRLSFATTNVSGLPNYDINLDGDGLVTFKVVPGTYAATLYLPDDPAGLVRTQWTLERTMNGATDTVTAELITPQGTTMAVTQIGPNDLVFQFKSTAGKIIFGRAPVGVGIGVSPATNYTGSQSGSGVTGPPGFSGPYAGALQQLLPAAGTTLNFSIAGHMSGAWTDTGGSVDPPDDGGLSEAICAPFVIDSLSGSGQNGFLALITEVNQGGATAPNFLFGVSDICVYDRGTFSQIWMRVAREGTAGTQAFQAAFAPDNPIATFYIRVVADLPTRVFNSDTGEFDSDALLGTQSLSVSDLHLSVRNDADQVQWYNSRAATGTETFTFSAH